MATQIAATLAKRYIYPRATWLAETIDRLTSEGLQGTNLYQGVLQAWCNSDIATTSQDRQGGLPSDCGTMHNKQLDPVALQVVAAIHIGESAFTQFIKLEQIGPTRAKKESNTQKSTQQTNKRYGKKGGGNQCDEEDNHPPGYHVMKLILTDGKNKLAALEYRFVPALTPDLAIGTKVILKGVRVAGGIALLEPGLIEVLGGSVPGAGEAASYRETLDSRLSTLKNMPAAVGNNRPLATPPNIFPDALEMKTYQERLEQLQHRFLKYKAQNQGRAPTISANQSKRIRQQQPQQTLTNSTNNRPLLKNLKSQQSTQPMNPPPRITNPRPPTQSYNQSQPTSSTHKPKMDPSEEAMIDLGIDPDLDLDFSLDDMYMDFDPVVSAAMGLSHPTQPMGNPQLSQQQQLLPHSVINAHQSDISTVSREEKQRQERVERQKAKQAEARKNLIQSKLLNSVQTRDNNTNRVQVEVIPSPFYHRKQVDGQLIGESSNNNIQRPNGSSISDSQSSTVYNCISGGQQALNSNKRKSDAMIPTDGTLKKMRIEPKEYNKPPRNGQFSLPEVFKEQDVGSGNGIVLGENINSTNETVSNTLIQNPLSVCHSSPVPNGSNSHVTSYYNETNDDGDFDIVRVTATEPIKKLKGVDNQSKPVTSAAIKLLIGRETPNTVDCMDKAPSTGKEMDKDETTFTFLSRLKDYQSPCRVTVQAYLMQIAEKLNRKTLSLVAEFDDGTARVKVLMDSEILLTRLPFASMQDYHSQRGKDNKAVSQ
eukprot:Ihof_evm29s18 gene=Ihof_evmTU29s18